MKKLRPEEITYFSGAPILYQESTKYTLKNLLCRPHLFIFLEPKDHTCVIKTKSIARAKKSRIFQME